VTPAEEEEGEKGGEKPESGRGRGERGEGEEGGTGEGEWEGGSGERKEGCGCFGAQAPTLTCCMLSMKQKGRRRGS